MPAAKIACPKCKAPLRVGRLAAPGRTVNCPKCGAPLEVTVPKTIQAAAPFPKGRPASATKTRSGADPSFADFSTPVHGPRAMRGRGWLVGGTVAGGMLTIAGVVALVLYLASADKNPEGARKPAEEPMTSIDQQVHKDHAAIADRDKKPPPKEFMTVLPRAKQLQVNEAIEAGKKFLKKHQDRKGVWEDDADKNQRHRVVRAALPALTLLECGEPASDPVIVRAAQYVRDRCRRLKFTYDIALAILLLDRLGDPSDESLIHTLALRLAAGQTSNGGWSYQCPLLEPKEEKILADVLKDLPLTSKLELMAAPRP